MTERIDFIGIDPAWSLESRDSWCGVARVTAGGRAYVAKMKVQRYDEMRLVVKRVLGRSKSRLVVGVEVPLKGLGTHVRAMLERAAGLAVGAFVGQAEVVDVQWVEVADWRRRIYGRLPPEGRAKEYALKRAKQDLPHLNWNPNDHHQAEAYCIAKYAQLQWMETAEPLDSGEQDD